MGVFGVAAVVRGWLCRMWSCAELVGSDPGPRCFGYRCGRHCIRCFDCRLSQSITVGCADAKFCRRSSPEVFQSTTDPSLLVLWVVPLVSPRSLHQRWEVSLLTNSHGVRNFLFAIIFFLLTWYRMVLLDQPPIWRRHFPSRPLPRQGARRCQALQGNAQHKRAHQ